RRRRRRSRRRAQASWHGTAARRGLRSPAALRRRAGSRRSVIRVEAPSCRPIESAAAMAARELNVGIGRRGASGRRSAGVRMNDARDGGRMTVGGGHGIWALQQGSWPERRTGRRRATVCRQADTRSITIGDVTVTPRFTMVVLLVADLRRSLAFYRRLGVEFPPDAESRTDVQVPLGDDHQLVITTTFV